jgi:hypothetical protein
LNQLVLERNEKENKIRKEIRDRERKLLEEEKYHTKLQASIQDKDIPLWNGKDVTLRKFIEEFQKFLEKKGLLKGYWYPIFYKSIPSSKLAQVESLMKPNSFSPPKINISLPFNGRILQQELQSSNYRQVIEDTLETFLFKKLEMLQQFKEEDIPLISQRKYYYCFQRVLLMRVRIFCLLRN